MKRLPEAQRDLRSGRAIYLDDAMITIHPISPENEMAIAERLRDTIATAWPDVATSERDHIDILVGVRTDVDVDLLVFETLERARQIPQQRRRPSGMSAAAFITTSIIAIEVKQLDYDCYERIGNQFFPIYEGRRENRSVSKQANDAALGVSTLARRYDRKPFVHNVATESFNASVPERIAEHILV